MSEWVSGSDWFQDSYKIEWELKDENGLRWVEKYREMSMSDFEVLYGQNVHQIIWVNIQLEADIKEEEEK